MNSWHRNTLQHSGGHQRSVSAAGYNDLLYPNYESRNETVPLSTDGRQMNQFYASHMDIRNCGKTSENSKQKFSWRSPAGDSSTDFNVEKVRHSSVQRPFESAFKAAISKMKESSIYRLNDVDKGMKHPSYDPRNDEDLYNRHCMTLQPKKTVMDSTVPRQSNKVFRCNSASNRERAEAKFPNDFASESESDRTDIDSINPSSATLVSDQYKQKKESVESKHGLTNGFKITSGSRVVIPVSSGSQAKQSVSKSSVVSETFISPSIINKTQSTNPKFNQCSLDLDESLDCEPLPSVQEIIAKVESLSNENSQKMMSKSLILTADKPPIKKLQKSGSQRALDGYSTSSQSDQSATSSLKRMSGMYKKNNPSPPPKGNSINKMPADFQKLHSAFLEQKQEIQNLKQELEERKAYIVQLESDLRNYEPWR